MGPFSRMKSQRFSTRFSLGDLVLQLRLPQNHDSLLLFDGRVYDVGFVLVWISGHYTLASQERRKRVVATIGSKTSLICFRHHYWNFNNMLSFVQ